MSYTVQVYIRVLFLCREIQIQHMILIYLISMLLTNRENLRKQYCKPTELIDSVSALEIEIVKYGFIFDSPHVILIIFETTFL